MRRGYGVKSIKRKEQVKEAFTSLGKELQEENINHVTGLMATFKESLEDFARKHKKDINANPVLRAEFNKMCAGIGVDPLASNKGFWAQLLGVGDFYYELAVQIIEICLFTRSLNGGLICLSDLTQRVQKRRKVDKISTEDIKIAINKVYLLGAGFSLLQSGKTTLVVSVPTELSSDHAAILQMAQASDSHVTVGELVQKLQWVEKRVRLALDLMMQAGMAWLDAQGADGSREVYWFPSLWEEGLCQTQRDRVTGQGGREEGENRSPG